MRNHWNFAQVHSVTLGRKIVYKFFMFLVRKPGGLYRKKAELPDCLPRGLLQSAAQVEKTGHARPIY
jgi:hypothetical protein